MCYQEDAIVCPFCGNRYEDDLFEYGDNGIEKCDECGNEFFFQAEHCITYSTSCVEHEYGEYKKINGSIVKFCIRCGHCQLKPVQSFN